MPRGPERAPSSPSPPGACAYCRVRRGVPVGLVRATPGRRRSSGAGCVPGSGSACHAPASHNTRLRPSAGRGCLGSPTHGLRRHPVAGGAGLASAWRPRRQQPWRLAGGGRGPQRPGPRRGRWPGQTAQGCAPEGACPDHSGASPTASQAEPAVRSPGVDGAPRGGLPCGAAVCGSRCLHATAVSQGRPVGVASRSQVVGVVAGRRVCGGHSVSVHVQARRWGRVGAEQRTGADRANGSLCFKDIVRGAAAHRGRWTHRLQRGWFA